MARRAHRVNGGRPKVRPRFTPEPPAGAGRPGRLVAMRRSSAFLLALPVSVALASPADARVRDEPAVVTTDNETPVLYDDDAGGNASGDDPAIWVHPGRSEA